MNIYIEDFAKVEEIDRNTCYKLVASLEEHCGKLEKDGARKLIDPKSYKILSMAGRFIAEGIDLSSRMAVKRALAFHSINARITNSDVHDVIAIFKSLLTAHLARRGDLYSEKTVEIYSHLNEIGKLLEIKDSVQTDLKNGSIQERFGQGISTVVALTEMRKQESRSTIDVDHTYADDKEKAREKLDNLENYPVEISEFDEIFKRVDTLKATLYANGEDSLDSLEIKVLYLGDLLSYLDNGSLDEFLRKHSWKDLKQTAGYLADITEDCALPLENIIDRLGEQHNPEEHYSHFILPTDIRQPVLDLEESLRSKIDLLELHITRLIKSTNYK